jgi:predicted O-methyltransferase YrrM
MARGNQDRGRDAARRVKRAAGALAGRAEPSKEEGARPPASLDEAIELLRKAPPIEIQRRGFHFQERDFYSGLNDLLFLEENRDLWHERPLPAGIEWDLDAQFEVLERIAPPCRELLDVPAAMAPGPPSYHWRNDFWSGADAIFHYGLLRDLKPRRVVEIGCGWSSLLMAKALARNEAEGAATAVVDQIEPYPRRELLSALPGAWNLHETILQRAPLELFESLEDGDVCFYDGSHVVRTASDVVWFFFEVVPRLRPGVVVHLHDVFWPFDYPDEWIFDRAQTWNEQYMLQAFLMYNDRFAPLLCNMAVLVAFPEGAASLFEGLPVELGGGSVWLRRGPAAG